MDVTWKTQRVLQRWRWVSIINTVYNSEDHTTFKSQYAIPHGSCFGSKWRMCAIYGTASVSCIVDKMEKATVPWTPILHAEINKPFFCLLWFLMLTKALKLEYNVLDFSVWAHGPWMALAIVVSQNRSVRNITRLQPLKVVENNFWFSKNLLPFYRPENSRNIFFNVFSRSVTWHYTNRLRPRSCVTWHQAGWGGVCLKDWTCYPDLGSSHVSSPHLLSSFKVTVQESLFRYFLYWWPPHPPMVDKLLKNYYIFHKKKWW